MASKLWRTMPSLARLVPAYKQSPPLSAASLPASQHVRRFAFGIGAGHADTPGWVPEVGNRISTKVVLQKARTWDEGAADKFKASTFDDLFKGKKVVLFAVPGAFTGVCEKAHVPSFSKNVAAFKAKGVHSILCIAVNDPYTMNAWKNVLGAGGAGIEFYSDSDASFTRFMNKEIDLRAAAMGPAQRSQRYAAIIEDGLIKAINVEKAPSDLIVSDGDSILKLL